MQHLSYIYISSDVDVTFSFYRLYW